MPLRNGKEYLKGVVVVENLGPQTTSDTKPIKHLLHKFFKMYNVENYTNRNNGTITQKEFVNQQIRDYRELFYLVGYYFDALKNEESFIRFQVACKNAANLLISQLKPLLITSHPRYDAMYNDIVLTGYDKRNAEGFMADLERFSEIIKY